MNKLLKLSLILLVFVAFTGCDSSDDDTSFLNDRTSVSYFVPGNQGTLLVEENVTSTYDIIIGVSEAMPFNRTFTYSIDPSSTAAEVIDYTLSSSLSVPANSLVGTITLTAGDYANTSLDGKTVKFNLDSVEDAVIGNRNQFTLNIIRYCPISAPFIGTYLLEMTSGGVPAAGFSPALGTNIEVEMYEGDTDTERRFDVKCYPAFGFGNPPVAFSMTLICGTVIANGTLDPSGVGCGSSIPFGPGATNTTFDPTDDSMLDFIFTEDVGGASCGTEAQSAYTLTKL